MDKVIKFNNQTAGRDKLARLLQYSFRAGWHYMEQRNGSRQSVDTLKSLEYSLSTFRKLLRLGRCIESLYGALSSMHYNDITVRFTATLSKIANALYLLCDHILWAARAGVADINTDKWGRIANKYWLYSVVMNLVRDFYEINRILEISRRKAGSRLAVRAVNTPALYLIASQHKDVLVDTVKNVCDVFIPMAALGYMKLSPGVVGLLGVVSSLAGIITIIDPMYKLCPS